MLSAMHAAPGIYALLIALPRRQRIAVGRLGVFRFPAGWYIYVGSARGPGGVRARVARHTGDRGSRHWHIDHLLDLADVVDVGVSHDPGVDEHVIVASLARRPGASFPAAGFGASDCRAGCPAHLLHFGDRPAAAIDRLGRRALQT